MKRRSSISMCVFGAVLLMLQAGCGMQDDQTSTTPQANSTSAVSKAATVSGKFALSDLQCSAGELSGLGHVESEYLKAGKYSQTLVIDNSGLSIETPLTSSCSRVQWEKILSAKLGMIVTTNRTIVCPGCTPDQCMPSEQDSSATNTWRYSWDGANLKLSEVKPSETHCASKNVQNILVWKPAQ